MLQSRGPAPPSVLPDISPSSGEIGSFGFSAFSLAVLTVEIGESGRDIQSPHFEGEMAGRPEGGAVPPVFNVLNRRDSSGPGPPRTGIPSSTSTRQIHASNDRRFENAFRVFGGKYSTLIDIKELESAMSDHHITKIASGMDRLSPSRQSMPVASGPGGPFAISLPSKRIFVSLWAQRLAKVAGAA
ncbi:hypothetical protein [Mesorhizobium sp. M7A.F.Ca.MR.148.00.0.0]|uniref:hypothetical protein n=1 Tax=Mesorhizobium sp. M7A.F.Ca.MR.148.00.0.0 TaxID=2496775 RepID=UPI0013E3FF30|nr:hypothetical protein [Mesorhizobium sp. M7A.F.Ca.MR.148.00.0.0]